MRSAAQQISDVSVWLCFYDFLNDRFTSRRYTEDFTLFIWGQYMLLTVAIRLCVLEQQPN